MKPAHSAIHFSDSPVTCTNTQKHFVLFLDNKLTFSQQEQLAQVMKDVKKTYKCSS